jgi:curved DNA-binding protein CbpA
MPEAPADRPLTAAELVRDRYDLIASGDIYALMGIDRVADSATIRNAYFGLAKVLHPDVLNRQELGEEAPKAVQLFKAVSEAYSILSDRRRKADYDARHSNRPTHEDKVQRDSASGARIYFHKGALLLQRRAYDEAEACFRNAVSMDATQPRYVASLGYALLNNETLPERRRLEEARSLFERAIELSKGEDAEAYYYLALYYKYVGNPQKQRANLSLALRINPKHIDAMREARLLAMRARPKSDLFAGFNQLISRFTKKK